MRTAQDRLINNEIMEFRLEILVAIYMACKAGEIRKVVAPNGVSYCISFHDNSLVISSKTNSNDLDTSLLPFIESKIGDTTMCFSKSTTSHEFKPIFFMVWEDFEIDEETLG
ncbi:hypothetical protein [Paenibacillus lutimineralis]|uniref:Uncharacterized protein n=1 Tax=Paenibacillus lutimineralis TaxID=2707005 RepID=A0A3Q9IEP0_9BACL|nr:hypothetical protein [Paenibacillus lutimineralis]AZS17378.1 hypothetical protein EI981_25125 [Paenibacillus lutimineralis]